MNLNWIKRHMLVKILSGLDRWAQVHPKNFFNNQYDIDLVFYLSKVSICEPLSIPVMYKILKGTIFPKPEPLFRMYSIRLLGKKTYKFKKDDIVDTLALRTCQLSHSAIYQHKEKNGLEDDCSAQPVLLVVGVERPGQRWNQACLPSDRWSWLTDNGSRFEPIRIEKFTPWKDYSHFDAKKIFIDYVGGEEKVNP